MVYTVIISHHQSSYIGQFARVLGNRPIVFVFDDVQSDDVDAIGLYTSANMISLPVCGNRSRNRNSGLSYIESHHKLQDDDIIEFFDGDRVPITYTIPNMGNNDVILYICTNDVRLKKHQIGTISTENVCNPFYSCGFAMKYSAIKRVKNINDDQLFNEGFTGWGCEDQYLGVQCHKLGLRIYLTDSTILTGSVGGDAVNHDNYRDTLQQYVNLLIKNNLFPNK